MVILAKSRVNCGKNFTLQRHIADMGNAREQATSGSADDCGACRVADDVLERLVMGAWWCSARVPIFVRKWRGPKRFKLLNP